MIIYSLCQLATKVSSIDPVKGFDPLGTAGVLTNGSASVVSNNLYDAFGVLRYTQGSAQTPWRWKQRPSEDEGIIRASGKDLIPEVAVSLQAGADDLQKCLEACKRNHEMCKMLADAHYEVDKANCGAVKAVCLAACLLVPPAKRGTVRKLAMLPRQCALLRRRTNTRRLCWSVCRLIRSAWKTVQRTQASHRK